MTASRVSIERVQGLGPGGHHEVAAAAHQQHRHPQIHQSGGENQTLGWTDRRHPRDAGIGQGGLGGGRQETALQHPADIAEGAANAGAVFPEGGGQAAGPCQLQGGGAAPGMADEGHVAGPHPFTSREAAGIEGIEQGPHVAGTPQEFLRIRWRGIARQHVGLLADVAAGVPGQEHRCPVAGQVLGPAEEAGGRIPEPVGDHHWRQGGNPGGPHHGDLKRFAGVGIRDRADPGLDREWTPSQGGLARGWQLRIGEHQPVQLSMLSFDPP